MGKKYIMALDQGPQAPGVFYLIMREISVGWHRKS